MDFKNKPSISIPFISWDEFYKYILGEVVTKIKDASDEECADFLLANGFTKLTKDNIKEFLTEHVIFCPNICVDVGDADWCYLVSGMSAIVIKHRIYNAYE